jgi:hypothetical protein
MRIIFLYLALLLGKVAFAQEETSTDKWRIHASVGHYPASLIVPSFSTIHPGINAGVTYQWNNHTRHQIFQSGNLGFFYHRDLQKAIQVFTELGYNLKFDKGFAITPLALGGGYIMSVSDIESVKWNETSQQYEQLKFPIQHNWMITLGASVSMETNLFIFKDRKTTFFADYRLLVQGVFVRETVPVIAYSPVRIGISIPL